LQWSEVWVVAEARNHVFPITPDDLVRVSGCTETDLKRI
jgi:hypothetical protein